MIKGKTKSKLQLSENLKLGVAAPASQSAFFKYSGVIFLAISLVLAINILHTLHSEGFGSGSKVLTSDQLQQKVLGAYSEMPASATASKVTDYKVQPGDTVFSIAQAQNADWQVIATLNNLKPPYAIKIGETLKVPLTR